MENTRSQQLAADGLVTAAVVALGAVLVAAGRILAGDASPGARGDWLRMAPLVLEGGSSRDVTVLLGLGASVVGLIIVAWWLLAMAFAVTSALLQAAGAGSAARWAGSFAPAFMRRLALTTLGLSLVTAPAVHAAPELPDPAWQATPVSQSQPTQQSQPALPDPVRQGASTAPVAARAQPAPAGPWNVLPEAAVPSPTAAATIPVPAAPEAAWVPGTPPPATGPLVRQPTRVEALPPGAVGVRPGDSLWSIVARHLGPGATDLEIAEAWPQWYAANANVIGSDPDLIRPGQLLVPPR